MRVRFAKSTGCPFGQFVIEAESKEDEAVLACFLAAPRDQWTFWQHGVTYGHYSPSSFNFGWLQSSYIAEGRRNRRWYMRAWRWLKELRHYRIRITVGKTASLNNEERK